MMPRVRGLPNQRRFGRSGMDLPEPVIAASLLSAAKLIAINSHAPDHDDDELADACARMASHPFVTVDTEFLRETTYYPLLCVAQMASPTRRS